MDEPPVFVCPRCGAGSYSFDDRREGYCGRCHDWTAAPSPETLQELLVSAEIALRNYLVAKSQALQPDGCCSDPAWRGHLCPYHEGYADGIDLVLDHSALIDEFLKGTHEPTTTEPPGRPTN